MNAKTMDDFTVGETVDTHGRTVTEADIVNFTGMAGISLPVFIDDEFCRKHTPYGGRISPGLMTAAFAVGMMEGVLGGNVIAALALDEFRFKAPVKPGDTIHARVSVLAKHDTSDGKRGVLKIGVAVINQRDEQVLGFHGTFLIRKPE